MSVMMVVGLALLIFRNWWIIANHFLPLPSPVTSLPKKFTGGNYGITTKLPKSAFKITEGKDEVKVHEADNGSGVVLRREFCGKCGSGLLEYGVSFHSTLGVLWNKGKSG